MCPGLCCVMFVVRNVSSLVTAAAAQVAAALVPVAMAAAMSVSAAAPQPVAKVTGPAVQKVASVVAAPEDEAKSIAFSTVTTVYDATAQVREMDVQSTAVEQVQGAEATVRTTVDKVLHRRPRI